MSQKAFSDTEIIICTERGNLEAMSKLLVWSVRNFGGKFRTVPIFSYQPRKHLKITRKTVRFFEKHDVEIIDEVLNNEFSHYPLANKPLATAHREAHTKAENLIFLDSDIFFLKEPAELVQFEGNDLIIRPVDSKNIGTENPKDENATYWQKLYNLLDVKAERRVRSTGDNKEILEYYNSGHVVAKTQLNLFNRWKQNFIKVMRNDLKPDSGLFFVEQSTLSATISQMELSVKLLEDHLNHQIFSFNDPPYSDDLVEKFKHLASLHYHREFRNHDGLNPIETLLNTTANGRIINEKISEFGVLEKPNAFTKLFNKQQALFYKLKRRLDSKLW